MTSFLPSYDFHIFICQNHRPEGHPRGCCFSKGADTLLHYMKKQIKALGLQGVRVNRAGCLDQCQNGIAVVVYPEGKWYQVSSTDDIEEIIQSHLIKKIPAEHLLMKGNSSHT